MPKQVPGEKTRCTGKQRAPRPEKHASRSNGIGVLCFPGFMSSLTGTQRLLRWAECVLARSPSWGVAQPPCPAPRELQGSQVPAPPGQACPSQSHSQVKAAPWPRPLPSSAAEGELVGIQGIILLTPELSVLPTLCLFQEAGVGGGVGGACVSELTCPGTGWTLQDRRSGGPESPHRGAQHAWTGSPARWALAGWLGRRLSRWAKWSSPFL